VTVQFIVPNSNISSHKSITQLNMTNTAFETVNMVKQPQAFNDHCCTTSCKNQKHRSSDSCCTYAPLEM